MICCRAHLNKTAFQNRNVLVQRCQLHLLSRSAVGLMYEVVSSCLINSEQTAWLCSDVGDFIETHILQQLRTTEISQHLRKFSNEKLIAPVSTIMGRGMSNIYLTSHLAAWPELNAAICKRQKCIKVMYLKHPGLFSLSQSSEESDWWQKHINFSHDPATSYLFPAQRLISFVLETTQEA